jgi:C-terminal processing protease CtpA/Prc
MGLTLNEAVDKMRGKVNTPITLTIMRPGMDEPFDVRLVRAVIRIQAVKSSARTISATSASVLVQRKDIRQPEAGHQVAAFRISART